VWKLAITSSLPSDEAISKIMVHFSSLGWDVYQMEGAYIAEGPHAYLGVGLLSIAVGLLLFILHPLLTILAIGVGVWMLSEKHAIALRYQNGMYLLVANTYEAYREAMRFAESVRGRIVHLEESGAVLLKTNYARALEDLGATIIRMAETPSLIEASAHEDARKERERGETELLTRTELEKYRERIEETSATPPSVGGEEMARASVQEATSMGIQTVSAHWSEAAKYRVYLATLEEMYKKGEVREEVYKKLKEEYEAKLRELEGS